MKASYDDPFLWIREAIGELVRREGSVRAVAKLFGVFPASLNRLVAEEDAGISMKYVKRLMEEGGWKIVRKDEESSIKASKRAKIDVLNSQLRSEAKRKK